MTKKEIERLKDAEKRIKEIAEEEGLLTTDIMFEIVPAERVLEGMSYNFPENFSYWQFGRDYEKHRTIYEHTGMGIPYEQVWNFNTPKALIVESNPFALNVMILAHVFGHVDFFLANKYLQHGRTAGGSVEDIAREARSAARRFLKYEQRYGIEKVEAVMDACEALQWHQSLDMFANEDISEEQLREFLIKKEMAKLDQSFDPGFQKKLSSEEIRVIEDRIEELSGKTPPEPVYDILLYILRHSKALKPWMEDIISVMRSQARHLAPQMRTKMLNEGWASIWHEHIMHRLFQEGFLDAKDFGVFNYYHSGVLAENKKSLNWYRVGSALFKDIKYRWDAGRFGKEYHECEDPYKKANWDTGAMLGRQKMFEVRELCTDRLAVELFFSDQFIHGQQIYFHQERYDPDTDSIVDEIVENNPAVIREVLKYSWTQYGIPLIRVENGNYDNAGNLLLSHRFKGNHFSSLQFLELNPLSWRNATLKKLYTLWQRPVYVETFEITEERENWKLTLVRHTFTGKDFIRHPYRDMTFPKHKLIF